MENVLQPSSASILVTEDCNLRCKYCFEHHNKAYMTKETAERALLFLASGAVKNQQDNFHAMIFGGEPLLNIDVIEFIFEKGLEIAESLGIKFTANIITNATVMNERIYDVLKKYKDLVNLNIQLSVDGIEKVQNEYRVTKTGKGSFDMVIKNIPKFQELYNNNPEDTRLSIHGCINHKTLPKLYENYRFFKYNLHFKQIWFLAIAEENWTNSDVSKYRKQCKLIYDDICSELDATNDIKESFYYSPFDRWQNCGKPFNLPCSAGRDYVTITANGEIYPCHQIYFNDPEKTTKIGDIFNGIDDDKRRLFLGYRPDDLYGCKDCKNNNCYRCLAANWMENGSVFGSITGMHCKMSSVENEFQQMLKEKIEKMSAARGTVSSDCLCNSREGTPIVIDQANCQSGNNPLNPDCLCDIRSEMTEIQSKINNDDNCIDLKTIADALVIIIQKLEKIEQKLGVDDGM